jgi:hypothetical protein
VALFFWVLDICKIISINNRAASHRGRYFWDGLEGILTSASMSLICGGVLAMT